MGKQKTEFVIVDYDDKYAQEINEMEKKQWGCWADELLIQQHMKEKGIISFVALHNGMFAGIAYGQVNQENHNEAHIEVICIKPEYQKKGLGTLLLRQFIQHAREKHSITLIKAEAVKVLTICNAKKLLEKNGFILIREEKSYWGQRFPETFCTECHQRPCICSALIYELKL